MAVRPWQNRFLDINLREGVKITGKGSTDSNYSGTRLNVKTSGKKVGSVNVLDLKTGPSQSDGCISSSEESGTALEVNQSAPSKPKAELYVDNAAEEVNSRPGIGMRSKSNPEERSTRLDKQAKKRLSLPNSGDSFSPTLWMHCISTTVLI